MFAVICALAFAAAPVPPDDSEKGKVLKALQGRWKGVAAEERGEAGPIKDFGHSEGFIVEGTTLTIIEKGKKREQFTIKFDLSKSPAHLDLIVQSEDGPQGTCLAIYKCEGGRFTICFARVFHPSDAEDRPTEFKTGPSAQRPPKGKVMYVFERVKD